MRALLLILFIPVLLKSQYTSIDGFAHGFYSLLKQRDSLQSLVLIPDSVETQEVVDSSLALLFRKVPNRKPITPEFRASLYAAAYKDFNTKSKLWLSNILAISDSLHVLAPDTMVWKLQKIKIESIPMREGSIPMAALTIRIRLGDFEREIELPILALGNAPKSWWLFDSPWFKK